MRYLTKARAVAGIPKRDELDFDLEPTDKQTGSDR
jgi:hypothetical protein